MKQMFETTQIIVENRIQTVTVCAFNDVGDITFLPFAVEVEIADEVVDRGETCVTYRIELPVREIVDAASGMDDAGFEQRFEPCIAGGDIRSSGEVHLIFQSYIAAQNPAAVITADRNSLS